MNQGEKIEFVEFLLDTIREKLITDIKDDRIPESWGGPELRELIAIRTNRLKMKLTGKRLADFKNDVLVNNL